MAWNQLQQSHQGVTVRNRSGPALSLKLAHHNHVTLYPSLRSPESVYQLWCSRKTLKVCSEEKGMKNKREELHTAKMHDFLQWILKKSQMTSCVWEGEREKVDNKFLKPRKSQLQEEQQQAHCLKTLLMINAG